MHASNFPQIPLLDELNFDKVVHAGLFGGLVFLCSFPLKKTFPRFAVIYLVIAIFSTLYGVAMEYVQKYFTTDRDFDVWDMVADGTGCVIAYCFIQWQLKKKAKR
jgi:VanZ family protein